VAKLPSPDPEKIAAVGADYSVTQRVMWRLHTPTHPTYPMRWDQWRSFGPLSTARFDPWLPPPSDRSADPVTEGVGYFGFDIATCLAEVFQTNRHISTTRQALQLSAFEPRRQLRLLDLRRDWPIAIGASHAINSGPKHRCRSWAEAIREVHPDCDGLLFTGMAGRDSVVLHTPPGDVFPDSPAFTKPLSDPGLASFIADSAVQIGYALD